MKFDDLEAVIPLLKKIGTENAVLRDVRAIVMQEDSIIICAGTSPKPHHTERLQYLLNVIYAGREIPPPETDDTYPLFCALLCNCYDVFGITGVLYALSSRHTESSWSRVAAACKLPSRGHLNIASDFSKSTISFLTKE